MILLKKCLLNDHNLYNFGACDGPSAGSEMDLYTNVVEMVNMLDPFEIVYQRTIKTLEHYDLQVDATTAGVILKPIYQKLRHGLAFDWVMNYCIKLILQVMPEGSPYVVFKGTDPFIAKFENDPIFSNELLELYQQLQQLFQWVVGEHCISEITPLITSNTIVNERSHYLVLLIELINNCIGPAKLVHWSEHFDKMLHNHPETEGDIIVVGGHFRVFAFGNLDDTENKWHVLPNGIKMSEIYRTQRTDYVRVFPDEMTFVRFEDGAMIIDETYFPMISIDNGPFVHAVEFQKTGISCQLDVPHTLTISYKFKQNINTPKQIKLRAGENCIIKDQLITLDIDGKATTQVVFRGNSVTFKISDPDKHYPFGFFSTKHIQGDSTSFAWL